jgi:putative phage-type endonuclease
MQQRTPEWFDARLGKVTASRVKRAINKLKNGGDSAERETLRLELIYERLAGRAVDTYVTQAMQWGTDMEPQARAAFESAHGILVDVPGFIDHPSIEWCGCSPDGFVGDDGLIEIKCPNSTTHLKWMIQGIVPIEHQPQMLLQMACAKKQYCHFLSFDPRLPEGKQAFGRVYTPKESEIREIEEQAEEFLATVAEYMERINGN